MQDSPTLQIFHPWTLKFRDQKMEAKYKRKLMAVNTPLVLFTIVGYNVIKLVSYLL